jgi:hypothetical protein
MKKQKDADDYVVTVMDKLASDGKPLTDKEERKAFAEFCLEHDLMDLEKAYPLYEKIKLASEDGKKEGLKLGVRKAQSGLKSSSAGSEPLLPPNKPRQTLEDIIQEAKSGLRT